MSRKAKPLRVLRAERVLTVRELADLANVAASTVHSIEVGRAGECRPSTMRKLAAALEVSVDEIEEFRAVIAVGVEAAEAASRRSNATPTR